MTRKIAKIRNSTAEFLIFTNQAKEDGIEVKVQDDTIWLSQKLIASLFSCSTDNISLHLKNIFKEGELNPDSVTEEFSVTATDGKNYSTKHYNLDAIIAVGYRINSKHATSFRQWATQTLRDYAIRGYIIDKERMKNGVLFNQNYFDSLLEEVREIRASEYSTKRSLIFMQQHLIMIPNQIQRSHFLPQYKTNYILPFITILPLN